MWCSGSEDNYSGGLKRVEGHLDTPDARKSGKQVSVQELELQLQQALQERDALLDHVLEQRGSNTVKHHNITHFTHSYAYTMLCAGHNADNSAV